MTFRHELGGTAMSIKTIRPSTLDGIKRYARTLKVERAIPYLKALGAAAEAGNFQNFKHAQNVLGAPRPPRLPKHCVYLSVPWRDKELGTTGLEVLQVGLDAEWSELITPAQLAYDRSLGELAVDGPDHLARHYLMHSQSSARRMICAAARTLHFMDATKLRPSKSHSRAFPGGRSSNAVPGRDHYSIWYDRGSKRFLCADEPYERAAQNKAHERETWSATHGFRIAKPTWPGMYNPDGGSQLYLIADLQKGIPLDPVVTALQALPQPIVEATWNGEPTQLIPPFISPGTIARGEATRAKTAPKKSTPGSRNTVGYVQTFVGPRRRPKGKLPIEIHQQIGNLLKSVLIVSHHRKGVYKSVNGVRSELGE